MNRYRMLRVTFVFALLAASLSFVACSDNNNNTEKTDTDGGSQKEGSTDNYPEGVECKDKVCTLTGVITESFKMTADKQWILSGGVFIGDDKAETVLTIEAGTKIYGETATIPGTLIIRRHSKIMAVGTKDAPIVFTSSKAAGSRARGDWGGVVINGLAKINPCDAGTSPCEALGEGAGKDGTGYYGGDKDDDNSGELKYVRVEFAGRTFGEKNELNGIAFQGVGSGTKISYIQVHMNKDDGVEFFGGTANFKYVLLTGIGDDNLDWTQGWRGKGQFLIAQQYDDAGDNGIEADNNDNSKDATPRSKPMLSNLTLIGSPNSEKSDLGMLLREGTAANISNAIIIGWNEACVAIDHTETFKNASSDGTSLTGELTLTNSYANGCGKLAKEPGSDVTASFKVEDFFGTLNADNKTDDPMLTDPFNMTAPNFMPKSGSPVLTGAKIPSDSFFDKVDFIGGMGTEDWTKGWTTAAKN